MTDPSAEPGTGGAAPHDPTSATVAASVRALPAVPATPAPAEPRQRWRVTFAREPVDPDVVGRPTLDAWHEALVRSGLPVAGLEPGGTGRARLSFAAPLPAAARGLAELADVWLLERVPVWMVREALEDRLPPAHRWIRAEDVWLGAPALAGRVAAADWLVVLEDVDETARERLGAAARQLLAAPTLPRVRSKGTVEKRYDLRPLLADITVADGAGDAIRIRTRFDPEVGSGRPDEVIAALAEAAGATLGIAGVVRERLILAEAAAGPSRRRPDAVAPRSRIRPDPPPRRR